MRLRHGMIVAQLALTLVLLVGAALLLKSFTKLLDQEAGFIAENLLVVDFELPGERYAELPARQGFFDELIPKLEAQPGIASAAVTSSHPFRFNSHERLEPEGYVPGPDEKVTTESVYVGSAGESAGSGFGFAERVGITSDLSDLSDLSDGDALKLPPVESENAELRRRIPWRTSNARPPRCSPSWRKRFSASVPSWSWC